MWAAQDFGGLRRTYERRSKTFRCYENEDRVVGWWLAIKAHVMRATLIDFSGVRMALLVYPHLKTHRVD